jgi:catechol 2,3-dioxygenase-like lactoylglutathione lyase family enzyme
MVEKVKEEELSQKQEWRPLMKRVSCIYLPSSDPKRSHEWFDHYFGLNNNGWTKLRDGTLIFIKSKEKPHLNFITESWPGHIRRKEGEGPEFEMFVLAFEVENTEKIYQSMKEAGERVELIDNGGNGVEIHFYDPDGNKFSTWELQVMVKANPAGANSTNWKDRFEFSNCCFRCDVDTFLNKIIEDAPGARHPRIQIVDHDNLRESDPEGLEKLLETLEQFTGQHPEHTFRFVYRE